jgi:hypothetical protein
MLCARPDPTQMAELESVFVHHITDEEQKELPTFLKVCDTWCNLPRCL